MKNEEFDDAIFKKIESINQTYTEEEVEKVFQHIAKYHPNWLIRWFVNSWFIVPISAAAMVGATYWSVSNFNQNQITNENVKGNKVIEQKIDIEKLPIKERSKAYLTVLTPKQPNRIEIDEVIETISNTTLVRNNPNTDNQPEILADSKMQRDTKVSSLYQDTVVLNGQCYNEKLFPNGIRLLAGVPMNSQSYRFGLSCELLVGNHFGFSTGVRYSRVFTEKIKNNIKFMKHSQHEDINHKIVKHVIYTPIESIDFQNNILQVPLFINYYSPLGKNIRLSFSLGTNIDIYLNQKAYYTHYDDLHQSNRDHFKSHSTIKPLNNIAFAIGVEKQWRNFGVQVRPYFSYQLKNIVYRPKQTEFGLEVSVMYSFRKKKKSQ